MFKNVRANNTEYYDAILDPANSKRLISICKYIKCNLITKKEELVSKIIGND